MPSRYLVLMPDNHNIGISGELTSRKNAEAVARTGAAAARRFCDDYGYIVRTAADGIHENPAPRHEIPAANLWLNIEKSVLPRIRLCWCIPICRWYSVLRHGG
ncbi:MAG: ribonuclease E/G [Thiolinea sp.]